MERKTNLRKRTLFSIGFLLLAFILPAISWNAGLWPDTAFEAVSAATPEAPGSQPAVDPAATLKPIAVKEVLKPEEAFEEYLEDTYDEMDLRGKGLRPEVFRRAMTGYHNLKRENLLSPDKAILSIVDLSKSSRYKRLWIIDVGAKKLLFHSYVSHGQGSGEDKAYAFSNRPNSHQSSLGFYITAGTYFGKHGLSLKLNGLDTGYNTNALSRAIVVHGADYVSKDFIKAHGRLGRSHGCPAIPQHLKEPIINTIKDKTVLYIDGDIKSYTSVYLNKDFAAAYFAAQNHNQTTSI